MTPNQQLFDAIKANNTALIEDIITKHQGQIDINVQDNLYGHTPLFKAVTEGSIEITKLLLKHGANINIPCKLTGLTPLNKAAIAGNTAIAKILLNAGANVHIQDRLSNFIPYSIFNSWK